MGFTAESDSTTPNNVSWVNRRKPSRIQNTNFSWRLEMPTCIANRALELAGLRVPDGWKFAFRTYNIISDNSKAVECVGMGDIQGLQELFSLRRATPFDRIDKNGLSLLHVSLFSPLDVIHCLQDLVRLRFGKRQNAQISIGSRGRPIN